MTLFEEQLKRHYQLLPGDAALETIRQKAWDRFQAVGLPQKNQEVWRSIKLRKLFEKSLTLPSLGTRSREGIETLILPGFKKRCLVMINGQLDLELSSTEDLGGRLIVSHLERAAKSYGGFLKPAWMQAIKEETDPFAVLNSALGAKGAFVYLPPNAIIEKPVQILSVHSSETSSLVQPRLHLFAGKGSRITLVSTPHVFSSGSVCNASFELSIDENADVSLYQLNHRMPEAHWQLETTRSFLKRDSRFTAVNLTNGSETVRSDYKAVLTGENGEVNLSGLWMLQGNREAHTNILIDHQAPHCRSNQLFKGVLDDASRSSFEGKIYVRQAAQKTDAFQLNNNLLLSEKANAFSKPNLEIFADDVKASHGATVGQLDKEQLFYLKSRGYSQEMAQKTMIKGFYLEIIDQIKDSVVRDEITKGW